MESQSTTKTSDINEILVNMAMHVTSSSFHDPTEIQRLQAEISIYINDLTFLLDQYHRKIFEAKHHLPDLEACEMRHLSTALRTWNKVIGR